MLCSCEKFRISCINYRWLPIKAHYFFMFGAIAGILSFMPVIGKDLGLSATETGITYTLLPLTIFLLKPCFGFLADWLQNIKTILICLISSSVVLLIGVYFIEPVNANKECFVQARLECIHNSLINERLSLEFRERCIKDLILAGKGICKLSYQNVTVEVQTEFRCSNNSSYSQVENGSYFENSRLLKCFVLLKLDSTDGLCENMKYEAVSSFNCGRDVNLCFEVKNDDNEFFTYQFWTFTVLVVFSGTFIGTAMSLTDVACYEILDKQIEYYGQQRLWGTISTGAMTLLTGYFNDLLSEDGKTNYLSAYYLMIILFIINMVILANVHIPKANISTTLVSDVKKLFKSPEFIVYGTAVFAIGNFSGLVANYVFWYLQDLGASQTLLGLTVTVRCVIAEIPFFFFAGWFIKHLGYFNCLTCCFAAFMLRFGLYSNLQNPWLVLPIEVLHGVTYAVFFASKTAFASVYALPGTEGTILGVLSGVCDGLGFASGSLLGGLGFDRLGGSKTFLIACFLSLICIPTTFISHLVFKKRGMSQAK